MDYIVAHRDEVEAEYRHVLEQAETVRTCSEECNRARFTRIAVLPHKPGQEALVAKLRAQDSTRLAVITILVDHTIEGLAALLWSTLHAEGWADLLLLCLARFADVRLPHAGTDREVWHFAQARQMLLTANRNMIGEDSLEQTIRRENHATALPAVTISKVARTVEATYREQCVTRSPNAACSCRAPQR